MLDVIENDTVQTKYYQTNQDIESEVYTLEMIFVNPSQHNYQLRAKSPAINKGDMSIYRSIIDNTTNLEVKAALANDLVGKNRIQGKEIDLGAYESGTVSVNVSYNANGAMSGDVPQMKTYQTEDEVTVEGNSGQLVREGYQFLYWNTKVDGTGDTYQADDSLTMGTEDVELYAIWDQLTHATIPTVTTEPEDKVVNVDEETELSVAATGTGVLSYQWYKNSEKSTTDGTVIAGATNATFKPVTTEAGTTYYYVEITNTDASKTDTKTAKETSAVVSVQVNALTHAAAPMVETEPEDKVVNVDEETELSIAATGTGTLSYQWYKNSEKSTTGGTVIEDANSATFKPATTEAGTTYYYVEITNTDTSKTGTQTVKVLSNVVKFQVNPAIRSRGGSSSSRNWDELSDALIKVHLQIAGGINLESIELAANTQIRDLPVPIRAGFQFEGWYQDEGLTKLWLNETILQQDMSIYAKWTEISEEQPVVQLENPPELQSPPEEWFNDIEQHWAKEMIDALAKQGIIHGYEDKSFLPNESITRMHAVVLIARAFQLEPVREAVTFSDVSSNHRYYTEISALQQAGIVDGVGDEFLPTKNLTRAQLAKILVGVMGMTPEGTSSFVDVNATHWSAGYIAVLEREGIALGDQGKFNPNSFVTRAQFAAFLYRMLHR